MEDNIPGLTYIDGRPYLVRLPISGHCRPSCRGKSWEGLVQLLDGNDAICHWKGIESWCQELAETKTQSFICCGGMLYGMARNRVQADTRREDIGFRPVLVPLNPETLEQDPDAWPGIKDGEKIFLGTLYMDGLSVPARESLYGHWAITNYQKHAKLEIADSHPTPEKQICFIKFRGMLWADRNLLNMISWNDLCAQGFCEQPKALTKTKPANAKIAAELMSEYAYLAWMRCSEDQKRIVVSACDDQEAIELALEYFGYPKENWPALSRGNGPVAVRRLESTNNPQVFEF